MFFRSYCYTDAPLGNPSPVHDPLHEKRERGTGDGGYHGYRDRRPELQSRCTCSFPISRVQRLGVMLQISPSLVQPPSDCILNRRLKHSDARPGGRYDVEGGRANRFDVLTEILRKLAERVAQVFGEPALVADALESAAR